MSHVLSGPLLERSGCRSETHEERRKRERLKVSLPIHVRPLDRSEQQIAEVAMTVDITRHGLYFATSRDHYQLGMSLFLTFPYCRSTLLRKEYVGQVVRVDTLANGGRAVAVRFQP